MKYKTIELSKFEKTKGSYSIYFVYPKNGQPVVIKGMHKYMGPYIKKHYPMALVRYTFWENGRSRGSWCFTCKGIYVSQNYKSNKRYTVKKYMSNGNIVTKQFKRLPKKWIPFFDIE